MTLWHFDTFAVLPGSIDEAASHTRSASLNHYENNFQPWLKLFLSIDQRRISFLIFRCERSRKRKSLGRPKLLPESGRRDSNPRPSAWKANALSTELLPRCKKWWAVMDSNHRRRKSTELQSVPFGHSGNCPYFFDCKDRTIS